MNRAEFQKEYETTPEDYARLDLCHDYIGSLESRIAELEAENAALTLLHTQATDEMLKMQNRVHELEAENTKLRASALVWHKYPAEKPPESGIEYLVLIDGEFPRLAVYGHHVLYEDDTMNKWYSDEGPAKEPAPYGEAEITHWAELPAPPDEEQ